MMTIPEDRGAASKGNKRIVQLLGLALVLAFLIAVRVLVALDLPHSYENSFLLGFLNTLFLGITPIIIAYVALRVYTKSRSVSFFLIGSGLLIFGLGSIAAGWVNPLPGGPNMTVTIHNTCACIGSIFILAGAVMSLSTTASRRAPVSTGKLAAVYAGIVVFVTLFSLGTLAGMVPPFFIPGTGPTILRQIILEDAVMFFAISSVLFMYTYQKRRTDFFFWFSVSLALIATGLLAVFFQPSVGSLIGWVGRTAQYLGCVFALYAVLIARQAATIKGISLDEVIANFFVDAEQSYKQLVETATDAIVTFDEDYRVLMWNEAAERMFGYRRDEAIGSSFPDLAIDGGDIGVIKNNDEGISDSQDRVREPVEITAKRKDGTLFPVELTISRRMQEGRLIRTCILRDLTERKMAERERAHLAAIVEYSDEAIIGKTLDGTITSWNAGAERTYGYSAQEMIGKNISLLVPPGHPDDTREILKKIGKAEAVIRYETLRRKKDGEQIDVMLTVSPVKDGQNRLTGVSTIVHDITGRKRMEEALRESNAYLNNLFDYANAPIIVWDTDYVITRFNHAFEDLTLLSEQEVTGQQLDLLFPEESKDRSLLAIKKTLEGERWEIVEIPILVKDGSVRTVLWNSANIIDPDGRIISTIAQGQDITERKELETEMEYHAQELQRYSTSLATANRKLNLLSSITRHDINNQLTVQMGYLEILEDMPPGTARDEYLQKVSTAAERISAMIRFTKEYEQIGVSTPAWQDCHTLVDTAVKEAPLGKVIVKNDLPAGMEMFADPLVVKVFYNLMDNAVRYGGKITTIWFSDMEHEGSHAVVCEDDGDGVAAHEKEKIFDRGFGKNTGLGLALSREILDITGISIREAGEPGNGARFEMTVPEDAMRIVGVGNE